MNSDITLTVNSTVCIPFKQTYLNQHITIIKFITQFTQLYVPIPIIPNGMCRTNFPRIIMARLDWFSFMYFS